MMKFSIREFWHRFNIRMMIVIHLPFYAFSVYMAIHRNATPMFNESRVFEYDAHTVSVWAFYPSCFMLFIAQTTQWIW
jgi:hypothetical protein